MSHVQAGSPFPADERMEGSLDLNEHLIKHKTQTFFVRVSGESMTDAGIFPGDLLIVDRAIEPVTGNIIIAVLNGELTVKRLYTHK
ncbi:MAG: LexA family transcriptional regulator, partial [Alphaproteobacteria bacterium]|nr:LexA family transcriptional regulator [Alphaproteobacteria bacterium]